MLHGIALAAGVLLGHAAGSSGQAPEKAKDDGKLPMEDHNTRLVIMGRDVPESRYVAEALAREAFHNVSYFQRSLEQALAALRP